MHSNTILFAVALAATLLVPAAAASSTAAASVAASASESIDISRVVLSAPSVDGVAINELSGLAWDADEKVLYAVSDQGFVYHFRLTVEGRRLSAVTPVPAPADNVANYRKVSRGLEFLAELSRYGVLTAPESPLASQAEDRHAIYAAGRHWAFPAWTAGSRLKGLDVLPDGSVLLLERSKGAQKKQRIASVRRLHPDRCGNEVSCQPDTGIALPAKALNFEGIVALAEDQVLLVSDNGGKGPHNATVVLLAPPQSWSPR